MASSLFFGTHCLNVCNVTLLFTPESPPEPEKLVRTVTLRSCRNQSTSGICWEMAAIGRKSLQTAFNTIGGKVQVQYKGVQMTTLRRKTRGDQLPAHRKWSSSRRCTACSRLQRVECTHTLVGVAVYRVWLLCDGKAASNAFTTRGAIFSVDPRPDNECAWDGCHQLSN